MTDQQKYLCPTCFEIKTCCTFFLIDVFVSSFLTLFTLCLVMEAKSCQNEGAELNHLKLDRLLIMTVVVSWNQKSLKEEETVKIKSK